MFVDRKPASGPLFEFGLLGIFLHAGETIGAGERKAIKTVSGCTSGC